MILFVRVAGRREGLILVCRDTRTGGGCVRSQIQVRY